MADTPVEKSKIESDTGKTPEVSLNQEISKELKNLKSQIIEGKKFEVGKAKSQEQIIQEVGREKTKEERGREETANTEKSLETAYGPEQKEIQYEGMTESNVEKSKNQSTITNKLIPNKQNISYLNGIATDATPGSIKGRIQANNNLVNEMIKAPGGRGRLFRFFGINGKDKI